MKAIAPALIIAAALAAILNYTMGDELDTQQARYCTMVKIYHDTDGRNGWPDYNGKAKEVCRE